MPCLVPWLVALLVPLSVPWMVPSLVPWLVPVWAITCARAGSGPSWGWRALLINCGLLSILTSFCPPSGGSQPSPRRRALRASARGVVDMGRLCSGLGSFALVRVVNVGRLLPCFGEGGPLAVGVS